MRPKEDWALRDVGAIFLLGGGVRILLNGWFHSLFGAHAVRHVEYWLYYGVALGTQTTAYGGRDPTVWLLRGLGAVFGGDLLFYSVGLAAVALTCATAALVYAIVCVVHGRRAGFFAGILYVFMVEPLTLSLAGFTHDHLAMPLSLAGLLFIILAGRRGRSIRGAAYLLLGLGAIYLASWINVGAYVALGVAGAYLASRAIKAGSRRQAYFTAAYVAAAALAGLCILPAAVDYQLSALPQGRLGSADVAPASLASFVYQENLLLLLVPAGLYAAYRRREYVGVTYLAAGLFFALSMERGMRIMDIGSAILASYALADWKPAWGRYALPAGIMFLFVVTVLTPFEPPYLAAIWVFGLAFAYVIGRRGGKWEAVALLAALGVCLTAVGLYVGGDAIAGDAEYALYSEVLGRLPPGRVLTGWDRGYMAETLSGMEAVSTAGEIDYAAHDALWMPERQANAELNRLGVDYVVASDRQLRLEDYGGFRSYRLSGGLVLEPEDVPPAAVSGSIAALRLASGAANGSYFRPAGSVRDGLLNVTHRVYGVVKQPANASYVTLAAYNNEAVPVTAEVSLELWATGNDSRRGRPAPRLDLPCTLACLASTTLKLALAASLSCAAYWLAALRGASGKKAAAPRRNVVWSLAAAAVAVALVLYSAQYGVCPGGADATPPGVKAAYRFNVTFPVNYSETQVPVDAAGETINCSATVSPEAAGRLAGTASFANGCGRDEDAGIMLVDMDMSGAAGELVVDDELRVRVPAGALNHTVAYSLGRHRPYNRYATAFWNRPCVKAYDGGYAAAGVEFYHVFCGEVKDPRG